MITTKFIGSKIHEARKKKNISQAQLAQLLFISPQAVGKWERGESFPDIITFNKLAELLDVDLNYFSDKFTSIKSTTSLDEVKMKELDEAANAKLPKKLHWNMSRGNWVDADFSALNNLNEKFSSSNMKNCKFIGSDLSGILLKSNNVENCDFSGSNISKSQMQNSNLVGNQYIGSNMSGLQLKSNNISKSDFTGANLSNGIIHTTNFDSNQFKKCDLKETEFITSHIYACDFSGADFSGAKFKTGGFGKNTIADVRWNRTSFVTMWLTDLVFEGTLDDCYFENCDFKRVTFKNSNLLNTFFKCKSLKKITFINCKTDRMTYEFLKNGKADLSGITLINS